MAQEILISINVNSGKAEANIKGLKGATNDLSSATDGLSSSVELYTKEQKEAAVVEETSKLKKKEQIAEIKALAAANLQAGAGTKQFRTQVGLNNAILQEAGRAASDLRFGFNGVANNVGQLASLFGSLINTSDNVGTSLRNLANSLLGTGGILIGVQLLIAYGDKIAAFFSVSAKEASKFQKAIDEATKSIDKQIDSFERLTGAVQKYGNIGRLGADANMLLAESASMYAKALEAIEEGAILTISEGFDKTFDPERTLKGAEAADELRVKFGELLGVRKEIAIVEARLNAVNEDGQKIIQEGSQLFATVNSKYLQLTRKRIKIEELFNLEVDNGAKKSKEFQVKIFEAKFTDFEKIEQRYREKAQKSELLTDEEILAQTQQNEMAKIDILEETFVRKQQLRLADYKDQLAQDVKSGNITQEEADVLSTDADAEYLKSIEDAAEKRKSLEVEVLNFISSLRTIQIRKDAEASRVDTEKMIDLERSLEMRRVDTLKIGFSAELAFYNKRSELLLKEVQLQQRLSDATEEGTLQRTQAEARLFAAKQQFLSNEVAKEKSVADEKMRINQQYIGFAQSMQTILSNLAGENEALQKAALIFEKGAAIADVVFKANAANAMITSNTVAAASATLARYGGVIPAAAPEMAAISALGAAQKTRNTIGAALAVGAIAATGYSQYKLIGKGGSADSAGGGVSVQAPDFNVVGASETNQLAQTVAGQTNEPIKAYVVGKDVTNQQEFDRNLINTAGI